MIFPSKFYFFFFFFSLIALIAFRQSYTQYCWLNGIIGCWVKHSSESEVKVFSLDGAHISLWWFPNLLYSSQHFFNMVISLSISPISLSTFQGISSLGYKIRWVKWSSVADWDLNVRQSNCISYWIGNKGQHGLPPHPAQAPLFGLHAKVDESPEEIERPYQSVW